MGLCACLLVMEETLPSEAWSAWSSASVSVSDILGIRPLFSIRRESRAS